MTTRSRTRLRAVPVERHAVHVDVSEPAQDIHQPPLRRTLLGVAPASDEVPGAPDRNPAGIRVVRRNADQLPTPTITRATSRSSRRRSASVPWLMIRTAETDRRPAGFSRMPCRS